MKRDIRRLSIEQQIAEVRKYHKLRAAGWDGDPILYPSNIVHKFCCICPQGLFQMYKNSLARKHQVKIKEVLLLLSDNEWHELTTCKEKAAASDLIARNQIERRRIPNSKPKRYEYKIK